MKGTKQVDLLGLGAGDRQLQDFVGSGVKGAFYFVHEVHVAGVAPEFAGVDFGLVGARTKWRV
jgi:hypothetical protein